jgi:hypothetical protein
MVEVPHHLWLIQPPRERPTPKQVSARGWPDRQYEAAHQGANGRRQWP